ncbi:MAG: NPCBM/NEW2 domain-containing protein [Planctomycetia bacterium]|nr:NPCBM/NEW2 domain-containing protein [Planctomycetia bacterium]
MKRLNWLARAAWLFSISVALSAVGASAAEPKFDSKVVSAQTKGHAVEFDIDIAGAKSLFLVATDGGDGFGCDWADWAEPRLVGKDGKESKLTEMKWKAASAGFGEVGVNKNCGGDAISIDGKKAEYGIGTHANSVIEFALPDGHTFTKFKGRAAVDDHGLNQGCGSTVRFLVFTDKPDPKFLVASNGGSPQSGIGSRDPKDAVKGLDVADGLEATLFASEDSKPAMLNPTSIDIDHLGRVWVCEVVNYRHRLGERKEGDRILILEDTDGDGVSDKQTVFHQGHDVDSAHGICVLPTPSGKGTKIIVSANDNVFFLYDDDGDLKSDRKEMFFTGIGGTQHDHGIHAFHFGPDGKLYFNFGNSGKQIKDKSGKPIIDLAGNEVNDSKLHYQEGMVFRCNMDGSEFETLGWNFRNNWEIAVDSFGTLWQSDNDDDGNKGVRINFVMEFGNYGYKDELTRAGWQSPRTNMEAEIPLRHWHLNDPGVVPNLLQTGAGSPTGIIVYEGDLLGEKFRNQVIHCDAGPNVVRAYPVQKSGAGYTAETVNLLSGARDNWFRPSDVSVAPDGSLIVADWYDPGVGGHRMGDADKGRLFRVAPPKTPYKFPKVDVSTVEGAIAALKSPNEATRYVAWTALVDRKGEVEDRVLKMFQEEKNPRHRARALWLLSKLAPNYSFENLLVALKDANPDVRIAALRAVRELATDPKRAMQMKAKTTDGKTANYAISSNEALRRTLDELVSDKSPEVRRECAIALRHFENPNKPELWAKLAMQHDGKDRWYLEALGIGAGNNWDAGLAAYFKLGAELQQSQPGLPDIVWRSRSGFTPPILAKLIQAGLAEMAPRYLRAFDFLPASQEKDDALVQLAFGTSGDEQKVALVSAEALNRLKGFDVSKNAAQKAALNCVLDSLKGQPQFLTLVEKFNVTDRYPDLLALAQAKPDDQIGIDAIRVLLAKNQAKLIADSIECSHPSRDAFPAPATPKVREDLARTALATVTVLSNSGDAAAASLLLPVVEDKAYPSDARRQAIKGATRTKPAATAVLKMAEAKAFDDSFAPALAAALSSAPLDAAQQKLVATLFPAPAGKDAKPLPPLTELAKLKGNAGNGAKLFASGMTAKCNNCHIVNNQGKDVGPNLSEIGTKLSRQAMWESIIYPSAGISHNYETYTAALSDGTVFTGLLISETADAVTIRNIEAITKTIPKKSLEEPVVKQKISLMPADLAKTLSLEEMSDIVEYLMTLKKK